MKRFAALIGLILLFVSCKSKNPAEQYGNTLIKSYKNTQQFGEKTSVQNLQGSINGFYAANGRYPKDLKELSEFSGVELDSPKYDYDPSTGIIRQKQ